MRSLVFVSHLSEEEQGKAIESEKESHFLFAKRRTQHQVMYVMEGK